MLRARAHRPARHRRRRPDPPRSRARPIRVLKSKRLRFACGLRSSTGAKSRVTPSAASSRPWVRPNSSAFFARTSGDNSASVESAGSLVNGGDRCETMPPSWSAATISGGRPARRRRSCNAAISALITRRLPVRDIALADVDTGDQPLLGKQRDLGEGGIADDEVPAERLRRRRLGLQHLTFGASRTIRCADSIDSGGRHHSTTSHRPAKPASPDIRHAQQQRDRPPGLSQRSRRFSGPRSDIR